MKTEIERQKWNKYMNAYYRKKVGDSFGTSKYTIKYTKEDVDFIVNNKSTMTNEEIGKILDVSAHCVKDKMRRMGISRNKEETRYVKIRFNKELRKYPKYSQLKKSWVPFVTVDGKRIQKSHHVWGKPIPQGYLIHHKDMNPHNNEFNSLQMMTKAEHNRLHTSNEGIYGSLKRTGEAL